MMLIKILALLLLVIATNQAIPTSCLRNSVQFEISRLQTPKPIIPSRVLTLTVAYYNDYIGTPNILAAICQDDNLYTASRFYFYINFQKIELEFYYFVYNFNKNDAYLPYTVGFYFLIGKSDYMFTSEVLSITAGTPTLVQNNMNYYSVLKPFSKPDKLTQKLTVTHLAYIVGFNMVQPTDKVLNMQLFSQTVNGQLQIQFAQSITNDPAAIIYYNYMEYYQSPSSLLQMKTYYDYIKITAQTPVIIISSQSNFLSSVINVNTITGQIIYGASVFQFTLDNHNQRLQSATRQFVKATDKISPSTLQIYYTNAADNNPQGYGFSFIEFYEIACPVLDNNGTVVTVCPPGRALVAPSDSKNFVGICVKNCDPSCSDCNGPAANQCTACALPKILQPDFTCQCKEGYVFDGNALDKSVSCIPCQGCKRCLPTDTTICTSCFNTRQLNPVTQQCDMIDPQCVVPISAILFDTHTLQSAYPIYPNSITTVSGIWIPDFTANPQVVMATQQLEYLYTASRYFYNLSITSISKTGITVTILVNDNYLLYSVAVSYMAFQYANLYIDTQQIKVSQMIPQVIGDTTYFTSAKPYSQFKTLLTTGYSVFHNAFMIGRDGAQSSDLFDSVQFIEYGVNATFYQIEVSQLLTVDTTSSVFYNHFEYYYLPTASVRLDSYLDYSQFSNLGQSTTIQGKPAFLSTAFSINTEDSYATLIGIQKFYFNVNLYKTRQDIYLQPITKDAKNFSQTQLAYQFLPTVDPKGFLAGFQELIQINCPSIKQPDGTDRIQKDCPPGQTLVPATDPKLLPTCTQTPCSPTCLTCNGQTDKSCTSCPVPKVLASDQSCVCPPGTVVIAGVCTGCTGNCNTCDPTNLAKCLTCSGNSQMNFVTNTCDIIPATCTADPPLFEIGTQSLQPTTAATTWQLVYDQDYTATPALLLCVSQKEYLYTQSRYYYYLSVQSPTSISAAIIINVNVNFLPSTIGFSYFALQGPSMSYTAAQLSANLIQKQTVGTLNYYVQINRLIDPLPDAVLKDPIVLLAGYQTGQNNIKSTDNFDYQELTFTVLNTTHFQVQLAQPSTGDPQAVVYFNYFEYHYNGSSIYRLQTYTDLKNDKTLGTPVTFGGNQGYLGTPLTVSTKAATSLMSGFNKVAFNVNAKNTRMNIVTYSFATSVLTLFYQKYADAIPTSYVGQVVEVFKITCPTSDNGTVLPICPPGYKPIQPQDPNLLPICTQSCDPTCATCIGFTKTDCVTCTSPRLIQPDKSCKCPDGQIDDANVVSCVKCLSNCAKCSPTNLTECTDCTAPRILNTINKTCDCPSNYASDAANTTCTKCDNSCATCVIADVSKCTSCTSPRIFDLAAGTCTCPAGQVDDANRVGCAPCSSYCLKCLLADPTKCTSCLDPRILNSTSKICECPANFIDDANKVGCVKCANYCEKCLPANTGQCTTCTSPRTLNAGTQYCDCPSGYIDDDQQSGCVKCLGGCDKCQTLDLAKCTSCPPFQVLVAGQCLPTYSVPQQCSTKSQLVDRGYVQTPPTFYKASQVFTFTFVTTFYNIPKVLLSINLYDYTQTTGAYNSNVAVTTVTLTQLSITIYGTAANNLYQLGTTFLAIDHPNVYYFAGSLTLTTASVPLVLNGLNYFNTLVTYSKPIAAGGKVSIAGFYAGKKQTVSTDNVESSFVIVQASTATQLIIQCAQMATAPLTTQFFYNYFEYYYTDADSFRVEGFQESTYFDGLNGQIALAFNSNPITASLNVKDFDAIVVGISKLDFSKSQSSKQRPLLMIMENLDIVVQYQTWSSMARSFASTIVSAYQITCPLVNGTIAQCPNGNQYTVNSADCSKLGSCTPCSGACTSFCPYYLGSFIETRMRKSQMFADSYILN